MHIALLGLLAAPLLASHTLEFAEEDENQPARVRIDDDPDKLYLLHAPERSRPPRTGWRLLVVMPGGDGSAEFAPFVGRIRENALGDDWLIAQMVAPVSHPERAKEVVWPTAGLGYEEARFTTEAFFAEVLADVKKKHRIDDRRVFTLAWSSSGSAAYSIALEPKSPVKGTFVAMSVYRPDLLPELAAARGRAFYLLHSPEDFIPISMAHKAREEFEQHGALVALEEYAGGHGWHGDVFGMLRAGVSWLEDRASGRPLRDARRGR